MSTSGAGRGRGWLNLNKTTSNQIGGAITTNDNAAPTQDLDQATKLVNNVNQLSINDDGIMYNQKLKFIVEMWAEDCKNEKDVEDSFCALYQKCLEDSVLASKLIWMVSSYTFITTEVHKVKIRNLFIGRIQNDFENCKKLNETSPAKFRNSVRMLGEFYNKARLADGRHIQFLATPLVRYLDMLLELAEPSDLELFTTQLYLNGSSIKNDLPQKLTEILNQVRELLVTNTQLTQTCRVWMLLALEVANNRFSILPSEMHSFYVTHLGDTAMVNFQGTHAILSVQTTHPNKSLDNYQSNVSVLQVTPPESTSPVNETVTSPTSSARAKPEFNADNWENSKSNKTGRPILGAGARLNKNKIDDANWRDRAKENSAGWDTKLKNTGGNWGKKPPGDYRNRKAWEHDDRFENDYN